MKYSCDVIGHNFHYVHETLDDWEDKIDFYIAAENTIEEFQKTNENKFTEIKVKAKCEETGTVKSFMVYRKIKIVYHAVDIEEEK